MWVERLATAEFRNLDHDPIAFSRGVNLLIGENGHGKTNLLEAIYFFKFGRSFRTARDTDLIRFGAPFCRFEVECAYAPGHSESFAASVERNGAKQVKHNDKEVARYTELVGRFPIVLFGPQDLELVSGYPAERRRFLDMVGCMTDRVYLEELRGYRRVLAQRNAALKARQTVEAHGVWTEELIRRGCALVGRRTDLVRRLGALVGAHASGLEVPYAVDLVYDSELLEGRPEEVGCDEQFAARLAAVEADEIQRRMTLVGPHRDDLRLLAAGRDLRTYGSQGQRRLAAVLLRLAELSHLEEVLGEPCVLLLDDLFSELDPVVSARLKRMLDGEHQIFVSSPVGLDWERAMETRRFRVVEGKIEPL